MAGLRMPGLGSSDAKESAAAIRNRIGREHPAVGLVLGSGLTGLADRLEDARRVPYTDIPGFPAPSVIGHPGVLAAGTLGGKGVVALAGRFHIYEGYDARQVTFPVQVLAALGVSTLFVSNASGGVRRMFRPGDLMIIADHVNLTGHNPLLGSVEPNEVRSRELSEPYDAELRASLYRAGARAGVHLVEGVYGWVLGPSYETPAEVRMLERVGVDAVGMSTVPEVLAARAAGMRVAGMSCVSNLASGLTSTPVAHADVLAATREAAGRFEAVVLEWLQER